MLGEVQKPVFFHGLEESIPCSQQLNFMVVAGSGLLPE